MQGFHRLTSLENHVDADNSKIAVREVNHKRCLVNTQYVNVIPSLVCCGLIGGSSSEGR